jgi:hypothetical protein
MAKLGPPAQNRCLEDLRLGNQSSFIRRPGDWSRALRISTIYD